MADNDPSGGISDADIDALLAEMNKSADLAASAITPTPAAAESAVATAAPDAGGGGAVDQNDIDALLNSATFADADSPGTPAMPAPGAPPGVGLGAAPLDLPDLQRAMVDVYVNERLVARGEVLVLNESFCVRVNEIVAGGRDDA